MQGTNHLPIARLLLEMKQLSLRGHGVKGNQQAAPTLGCCCPVLLLWMEQLAVPACHIVEVASNGHTKQLPFGCCCSRPLEVDGGCCVCPEQPTGTQSSVCCQQFTLGMLLFHAAVQNLHSTVYSLKTIISMYSITSYSIRCCYNSPPQELR
jgi:hypothetical protein